MGTPFLHASHFVPQLLPPTWIDPNLAPHPLQNLADGGFKVPHRVDLLKGDATLGALPELLGSHSSNT